MYPLFDPMASFVLKCPPFFESPSNNLEVHTFLIEYECLGKSTKFILKCKG